jgi:rhodanese-related sulfurtransferase
MGNSQTTLKINFEDMQTIIKNTKEYLLINVLSKEEQSCLIFNTIDINNEENIMNNLLENKHKGHKIVIYGKNSNDEKIFNKYNQLKSLGFLNIYIYTGGLFEWMLLQDIYGENEFPTTSREFDILKFKPTRCI